VAALVAIGALAAAAGAPGWAAPAHPGAAPAPAADAVEAARALEARLAAVRGLRAHFIQTVDSPALAKPMIEVGTVYILRPGRMRWEYSDPPGKLAIADGSRTWLYLPEDRQVIVAALPTPRRPARNGQLMAEHPDLLSAFTVGWGTRAGRSGRLPLSLKPRNGDAPYDEVLVETDRSGFPEILTVLDPLGGRVTYRLEAIDFKPPDNPALYAFTPPAGVEVREAGP
jgi:outer membrane lipoprotein carrier protein